MENRFSRTENLIGKEKMDKLIELSLKQNFSVIVQKHENEE